MTRISGLDMSVREALGHIRTGMILGVIVFCIFVLPVWAVS